MKKIYLIAILTVSASVYPQIGIGTTTPNAALEVNSTDDGLLIPRIALTNTNTATVITPTTSELIYNTATIADVTPGFYFWNGTIWVRLATASNNTWTLTGNSGTTAGTNFIGTTDATGLRIKTNSIDRWNISNSNNGQLQSYSLGSSTIPTYSWQTDTDTGIFSPGADIVAIASVGLERMRVEADGDVAIGATLASNKLHVVNNADGAGVMRVDNGTAGGFSGLYFFQGASYRGHIGYVNTGGESTFGGKGAYQIVAGNRPIIFSTNPTTETYIERMIIAQDGSVGINTNPTNASTTVQPNSTLQVNGSLAIKTASISSTSTLANDVCKVFLSNGGTNITITLPDPATCIGRLISFTRFGSSSGTVTLTPIVGGIQNLDGTIVASTTIGTHSATGGGVNIQFWSNGSNWYR